MAKRKLFNKKGRTPYKSVNARTKEAQQVRKDIKDLEDLVSGALKANKLSASKRELFQVLVDKLNAAQESGYRSSVISDVIAESEDKLGRFKTDHNSNYLTGAGGHDRFKEIMDEIPESEREKWRNYASDEVFDLGYYLDEGISYEEADDDISGIEELRRQATSGNISVVDPNWDPRNR